MHGACRVEWPSPGGPGVRLYQCARRCAGVNNRSSPEKANSAKIASNIERPRRTQVFSDGTDNNGWHYHLLQVEFCAAYSMKNASSDESNPDGKCRLVR